ncbi:hypothetical protein AB0J63_47390 [Streptosporangium canum]|uniref:hypothetical protein n=1 Tax=Streptosporangium canum TaxID=324952 RepID=UPI0034255D6A
MTEAGTALEQARPLVEAFAEVVDRFAGKVEAAERGALTRLATLEAETADDRADAAREQAAAAETARITAERSMRAPRLHPRPTQDGGRPSKPERANSRSGP